MKQWIIPIRITNWQLMVQGMSLEALGFGRQMVMTA